MFKLTISLDNEAMESTGDVSRALAELAERLDSEDEYSPAAGTIRDANGNAVGTWSFNPGE